MLQDIFVITGRQLVLEPTASLRVQEVSSQSTQMFYKHGATLARW